MAHPEQQARQEIDRLLAAAGWHVCDMAQTNIHAARGVALREFPLNPGHGFADYLLYIDGKAAGIIEAKKQGATARPAGVRLPSPRDAGRMAALPARCGCRPESCRPASADFCLMFPNLLHLKQI